MGRPGDAFSHGIISITVRDIAALPLPWAINGVEHPAGDAFAVLGVGVEAIALPDEGESVVR
jgi:hypothetical protein